MFEELLAWYLAPWRRMGRVEFGVWLFVVTLPGLILMMVGFGHSASGWLSPLTSMAGDMSQMQGGGDASGMLKFLQETQAMQGPAPTAVPAAEPFDWTGFVNSFLMLVMIPLCKMRALDTGKDLKTAWFLAVLFNVKSVGDLLYVFGLDVLPMGWMFGMLSFGGYIWLCMAGSAPRVAPYERIPVPGRQE